MDCSAFDDLRADIFFLAARSGAERQCAPLASGRVLWLADTATGFDTINGLAGHGGAD
jgi:hypothetical protein